MNKQIKSIAAIFIIIAAMVGLIWLAKLLGSGEKAQSEKPIAICNPPNVPPEQPSSAEATAGRQTCSWTAHIHATVKLFKQGKEIPIKFEVGELEGQHTHSEPNKLHWHGLIPVDSKTKEVTDWSALEVQRIVADFGLSQEGTPKFIVNGQEVDPSFVWQDDDVIEIHYE